MSRSRNPDIQINLIDDICQFDKLQAEWNAVYAADPHTTIFVSWAWLRGWCETTLDRWLVLAARPDDTSPAVAFLALSAETTSRRLHMGGNPWADHTGFVCLPEYEEEAIEALATFVQKQLRWDNFNMRDVHDPRLDLFIGHFSTRRFIVQKNAGISCPYIPLPNSWEQYLQDFVGSRTRKNLRRFTRLIEGLNGFRTTQARADNLAHHIDTLLMLYQMRWGEKPKEALDRFRFIFHRCFENDCLWLSILWDADTPVVATVAFVDRHKKVLADYIGGWDDQFTRLSPGSVMTGYSIQYAIENGFREFDFLRGDESYKLSFGAKERFNTNVTITRQSLRLTAKKLLKRVRLWHN